jgi:sodium/potassium-transporting ATPase subunit alpha
VRFALPKSLFVSHATHSGRIAKLSSAAPTSMTTLQREILRFVIIIASLATIVAIIIVILWAAW